MKYIRYLIMGICSLMMLSFAASQKERKRKPAAKAPFGYVQSVREITYHAIEDSSGGITKGNIISDTEYNDREGEIKSNMHLRAPHPEPPVEMWVYDEYGDEIESDKCHANGALANKVVHIYYENGDVREIIDSSFPLHYGTPTVKIQQYTYQYDSLWRMLTSNKWEYYITNKDNPSYTKTVYTYDSTGKLRETDERKSEGGSPDLAPFEKNDFWYDRKGRMYDKATYHPNVGLVKDEKITFDSAGKTITTYSYTNNRVLTGTVVKRIFNATGTIQEDTYDRDGFLTDYSISHDSAKHLMDKGVFHVTYKQFMGADRRYHNAEPGDTEMVHHIINDNNFNVVEDDSYSNTGKPISQKSYQYTYDDAGNWIAKIQFNNNKAVKITEREIAYFKDVYK